MFELATAMLTTYANLIHSPEISNWYSYWATPTIHGDICFIKGTMVHTDQGHIKIEELTSNNTINKNFIKIITKTKTLSKYLICINKNALSFGVPNKRTIVSGNHKIFYNKEMIKEKYLVQYVNNVYKIANNGENLYNVLMDEHNIMKVHNMTVETLHPKSQIAQVYTNFEFLTPEKKNIIIKNNKKYLLKKCNKII